MKVLEINNWHKCKIDKKVYKELCKRSDWQGLIKSYIAERRSLKRVFTLVDARHGLKENDREFFYIRIIIFIK